MRFRLRKRHRAPLLLCLFILPVSAHFILRRSEPVFYAQCSNYSNTAFTELVNGCIADMAQSDGFCSFFNTATDESGRVNSVEADTARINSVKSRLLTDIRKALSKDYPASVGIPLGSLSRYPVLAYYGPTLHIRIIPISIVNGELDEKFESVGINQVLHRITLNIYVDMRYIGYTMNKTERITAEIPIAETLISGSVPEYYGTGIMEMPH
ncbi:MAG: sporulation protein YunB [Clostridia bacterium]|nr:sporulation protein YunB [Clostridia bacterium]